MNRSGTIRTSRPSANPLLLRAVTLSVAICLVLSSTACSSPPTYPLVSAANTSPTVIHSGPYIEITPLDSLADQKLTIRLLGFEPYQEVTLEADVRDHLNRPWKSNAMFKANAQGEVDLGSQKPASGTYNIVDSMGLFWSMHLFDSSGSGDMNLEDDRDPNSIEITFAAKVNGHQVAATTINREIAAPDVRRTPVNQNGLAGVFYLPAGQGPHPGVVILGGAEGGLHSDQAALLASHGFASLALAYFGYDGLPPTLENIPIEYFETAIRWLQAQPAVRVDRLAVVGASRGGELGLLLGTMFPEVKAIVGYVPASHLGPGDNALKPAWTFHGAPLPYVHDFDTIFAAAGGDTAAVQEASTGIIHVEKIDGPVLLISGKDDRLWPSFKMSSEVMNRLAEFHHPFPDKHLSYDEAGHLILMMVPYLPYTAQRDPVNITRYINYYGGTAAGDAIADADSWPQVISFLTENLK